MRAGEGCVPWYHVWRRERGTFKAGLANNIIADRVHWKDARNQNKQYVLGTTMKSDTSLGRRGGLGGGVGMGRGKEKGKTRKIYTRDTENLYKRHAGRRDRNGLQL